MQVEGTFDRIENTYLKNFSQRDWSDHTRDISVECCTTSAMVFGNTRGDYRQVLYLYLVIIGYNHRKLLVQWLRE